MKVERVSYDIITPSAARGILEAIHWKPEICWAIDRLHVLRPIRFDNIRRNEVGEPISAANVRKAITRGNTDGLHLVVEDHRQQRATLLLRDVAYVIEAHFTFPGKAPENSTHEAAKHLSMFNRRVSKGQCFHRPYLGTREFPAHFSPIGDELPPSSLPESQKNRDLGWMLHDIDFANGRTPRFFRAVLRDGVVDVPQFNDPAITA